MNPAVPLPAVSLTDALIWRYYDLERPTPHLVYAIHQLVHQVEHFLCASFQVVVRLEVFGSFRSGFGSFSSDIDVSLRFLDDEPPKDLNEKEVILKVWEFMKSAPFSTWTKAITATKVPIAKCVFGHPFPFSMDISYYNTLAVDNSRLLAAYCAWEPERLPQLGLWVKKWAKEGGICNPSNGFISSYAFIILLIHYLQNCTPPVLPRLQENSDEIEILHSSAWNTYFLEAVVPNWSGNKQPIGELFRGFLNYYVNFDFNTTVVQIRRKDAITKAEKREKLKKWQGRRDVLAIEDPFELDRNLGERLTLEKFQSMQQYFFGSEKAFELLERVHGPNVDINFFRMVATEGYINGIIIDAMRRVDPMEKWKPVLKVDDKSPEAEEPKQDKQSDSAELAVTEEQISTEQSDREKEKAEEDDLLRELAGCTL